MNISHAWLQSYFAEPIPSPADLADLFSVYTCEVEGLEEKAGDTIFDLKILPDRAHYMLCHSGIADEIRVLTGQAPKAIPDDALTSTTDTGVAVSIQTPLARRYMAQYIEFASMPETPEWIARMLASVGQKRINFAVDLSNFMMLHIGQPMHMFDADKVRGGIVVRMAEDGEKITILGGEEKELQSSDIVIADDTGPLAIAGVKGGARAEVTAETKRIIIESANFDPASVRRTSTRLNLRNDSSKRFENEITPALAEKALNQTVHLCRETDSAVVIGTRSDIYTEPVQTWTIATTFSDITKSLGLDVPTEKITDTLERMDCILDIDGDTLTITPPLQRLDMMIPADIVDEIGRIVGYDDMVGTMPPAIDTKTPVDKTFFYAEKAKNTLIDMGYSETMLYTLVTKGDFEIIHPLASDKKALRTNLSEKLIESLIANTRNADLLALPIIKICEIGRVFLNEGEKTHMILGVSLVRKQKGVTAKSVLEKDIAGVAESLGIDIDVSSITEGEYGAYIEIDLTDAIESLPQPAGIAELSFQSLSGDTMYTPFSVYPYISRDIAVFVEDSFSADEVFSLIVEKAGDLYIKGYMFDEYHKDGKVSYAFRLIFQSFERTLTDIEVGDSMAGVEKAVQEKGWEVR